MFCHQARITPSLINQLNRSWFQIKVQDLSYKFHPIQTYLLAFNKALGWGIVHLKILHEITTFFHKLAIKLWVMLDTKPPWIYKPGSLTCF